ncbi:MAG TPA: hypothetical protein PLT82_07870 [Candidatus Hydrogenedens sp.]|nr:hypothetical protein [Candidatus Hydrogenedens sp.]HOL19761.1 hypothetical protein [Candidatus Hydrogenedens sp.]HPP59033.1 hypothetical protein [Candidatus Hydrogenedens sp.]
MALSKKQQKIVDILNKRVELCREFLNDWLLFNQIINAYPSPGANKAQLENQFLKIKSKIARTHKVLKELLMEDYQIDSNLMNLVSAATSLEAIYSQSEVSVKKMQQEWHRAFISINETLGILEDKKTRAEAGEKINVMMAGEGGLMAGAGGLSDNQKTFLIIGAVIAGLIAIYIIDPFGIATLWLNSFKSLAGQ